MTKKQQNLDDLRFIYEKVDWYLKQKPEDLIRYFQEHRMDSLYSIPDKKLGMIICGREASEKFYNIAERYLGSQTEGKNKTNLDEFVKKLKEEFSRRFLQNSEEINDSKAEKMLSTAYKSMSREFKQLTHYIPCAIFFSRTIDSFEIGPISFLHKTKFESIYGDEIDQLRIQIKDEHREHCAKAIADGFPADRIATEEQSQQLAERLVGGLLSSFENWEWIAVVTISECNEKISYTKAISVTKTALNILKLLFGSEFADQIRTEKDYGESSKSARLTRIESGKLEISLSSTAGGNVIGDKWLEILSTEAGYYFDLATKTLKLSLEFSDLPPLCARFIDALSWYGDAVSEQSYAAKIVKFVTSIERITGTGIEKDAEGNERGVTDIVTNRSSILYSLATDEPLADSKLKVSTIYKWRSDLVHGSLSPFDESCVSYAHKTGEISRMVLLAGLDYFFSLDESLSKNPKQLKEKYKELEAMYSTA
ncbi:MAG TPA: hypothetical protein VIF37_12320 [Methylobacter sp.]|jgi:hypothetical protein